MEEFRPEAYFDRIITAGKNFGEVQITIQTGNVLDAVINLTKKEAIDFAIKLLQIGNE